MLPTSDPAKRLHALFNRRPDTHWDTKEVVKFRQLVKNKAFEKPEDLELIERYTISERKKGLRVGYYRRNLYTLMNNWCGELDKAREWEALHPLRRERKIIAMPPQPSRPEEMPTPEEIALGQTFMAELRARQGRLAM